MDSERVDSERFERKIRSVRRVIFMGAAWFVCVIVVPDYVMGLIGYANRPLHAVLDACSIFVILAATIYVMLQIRTLTNVVWPILFGLGLLIVAQVFHILGTMNFFIIFPHGFWMNLLYHSLVDLPNGFGMLLFAGGLFYSIVELLVARHSVETERELLVHEVAERKRAESEIAEQQLKIIAASRMSALGNMAGSLAHEINNPLAILSGHCQQLSDMIDAGCYDPNRLAHLASVMTRNVTRIENTIHGLRRLSRNDETDPFSIARVDQIVSDAVELCKTKFREHGIMLTLPEISPDLRIECRPTQISQVILNLLANAHDAVYRQELKRVDVFVRETDSAVLVSVEDTGPGVEPQALNRIFDPFFSTKPPGEGVGVGLSISRRIIDAHDGKLFLDQTAPKTRFVVQLRKSITAPIRTEALDGVKK